MVVKAVRQPASGSTGNTCGTCRLVPVLLRVLAASYPIVVAGGGVPLVSRRAYPQHVATCFSKDGLGSWLGSGCSTRGYEKTMAGTLNHLEAGREHAMG